jgi:hypothetical protein
MTTILGALVFLVVLAAGLYLGTASLLTLSRQPSGAVTAVNAWRLAGRVTLLARTVTGLRDAEMDAVQ